MISFKAVSIGSAAARELASRGIALRLHSVFPSTVNLAVGTTGRLLALTRFAGRIYPYAIAIFEPVDFTSLGIERGCPVRFNGNVIEIDDRLAVDLTGASVQPWRSLVRIHADRQDCLSSAAFVSSLIGLGPGLTPSGDDFLCGFMAAVCARDDQKLFASLAHDIEDNLARTGEISSSMLRWMLLGYWPDPLLDLAEAIAEDREEEAWDAFYRLCDIGHSSGADLAAGFLSGLTNEPGSHPHLTQRSTT